MSTGNQGVPLQPTYKGLIANTLDALILFEACLNGQLNHVHRRPHDRERESLIRSGNVFIYEENASGIKRWTDGNHWSPSRILGNFLLYRELDRPFAPGEKKRANRRKKSDAGIGKPEGSGPGTRTVNGTAPAGADGPLAYHKEIDRSLIGSLVDSYAFKEDGLVKKTVSVRWNGIPHHLVAYYTVADAQSGRLMTPRQTPELGAIIPRSGLIQNQDFRVPVDQDDIVSDDFAGFMMKYMQYPRELPYPGNPCPRSMSVPTIPHYPGSHGFPVPQPQPQIGGLIPGLTAGYYMQPNQHGYVDPVRSQSTSVASMNGYTQPMTLMDNGTINHVPRRHSATYEPQANPAADPALSPLPTIPEARNTGGQEYFHSAFQFGQRQPSVAVSPEHDLFDTTTRDLVDEPLVSFDRSSQALDMDDVDRNWFSSELENTQPQFLGGSQAGWPRGVSRT
ncbi:Gti1/Pac2 family protein [Pleurostoma richardsiae]|uniref:Gti1/Pac2 family protein n=1 Tax=Pleurostoma richardsiae TaxID=41990 RepID=A0AA38VTP5_9PEZI|nr:Gti1/Pac2 family protein [Pleurostoma richardsiae]